ncbi:hypothetical protein J2I47_13945 [Fibrella sp. HMF5335]|uniref:Lipoprotein n=1 Tax=Fibrella rubiginis TaxID=2817060 RepID=A0A939GHN6_9BACT|nr:hypothetical protein [Fibrella rubiginis]MBO0937655.1 hypothetical protein [Fibrella rubiginis]
MKTKQLIVGLAVAFMTATTIVACDSKKENKAEDVQDAKEDLNEARAEGDTSEMRDEKANLDSAKAEYNDAAKEARKDSMNK